MSRRDLSKNKTDSTIQLSNNYSNEGSAARTRPFSFEDIMLRRKNKKLVADAKDDELKNLSLTCSTEPVSGHPDSDGEAKHRIHVLPGKSVLEDASRRTAREKQESRPTREADFIGEKANHDLHTSLRDMSIKDRNKEGKKAEISHSRNRTGEDFMLEFENNSERRKPKKMAWKDKYSERDKIIPRDGKRKHDDRRSKIELDGSSSKSHIKRHPETALLERKDRKESVRSSYDEGRSKRRRSRSQDRDRGRNRQSRSSSPKVPKHEAYEPYRSGRQHSEVDKSRYSRNGRHSSGHYRRHAGHSSGLGGYSPRKRRSEAAVKTPSPTKRSPERKAGAWDLPPLRSHKLGADSVFSTFQKTGQAVLPTPNGASAHTPVTTLSHIGPPPSITLPVNKDVSIDSIQLTQATRPMRRLYVENIPASASEKTLMDFLNDFLLSSGVNHIEGTKPCISCIINKEKCQAILEFLTPEDATSALTFDGKFFCDAVLKVRRPKDFIETPAGVSEKLVSTVAIISDVVKDSPHKIFIGGISKRISADMLKEIVSAFGVLKAFRFELNKEYDEQFAFLEFADHSITPKACAGLNGMKLAGNVLTVVLALPKVSDEDITYQTPFYGVPEYVKPLMEKPTQVLKLLNVFNEEGFLLLSEPELEEILEDIRLECARFGTIKSMNIVKYSGTCPVSDHDIGGKDASDESISLGLESGSEKYEVTEECRNCDTKESDEDLPEGAKEHATEDINPIDVRSIEHSESGRLPDEQLTGAHVDESVQTEAPEDQFYSGNDANTGTRDPEQMAGENDQDLQKAPLEQNEAITQERNGGCMESKYEEGSVFEEGSILVEYVREEAACVAAHALHGRLYGDRIVSAGYAPHDRYCARFPKGSGF